MDAKEIKFLFAALRLCVRNPPKAVATSAYEAREIESRAMAEFICRLGTPAGEVVTRTVEAPGIHEARARLEREGFRVFNVSPPRTSGVSALT